jgi:hypothetical protein
MSTRASRFRSSRATMIQIAQAVCVYENCSATAQVGLPVDIHLCQPHFERIGQMYVVTSDRVRVEVEEEFQFYYVSDTEIDQRARMAKMQVLRDREARRKLDAELEQRNKQDVRPTSVVYYLAFDNRIKIGTSTNLAVRLRAVPHDEVLTTELGDHRLERQRHRQFAGSRLIGEWFSPTGDLLAHIDALKHAAKA